MNRRYYLVCFLFACLVSQVQSQIKSTLKADSKNPRYFSDNSGRLVYLTGSHTWENLQDMLIKGDKPFDFAGYLEMMKKNGHNFMRMWMFEQPLMAAWTSDTITFDPLPFARTGPGIAQDGKPKFDLTKYNPAYFKRLRQRVIDAGKKNIYVSVMLFQGWSLDRTGFGIGNPFPFPSLDLPVVEYAQTTGGVELIQARLARWAKIRPDLIPHVLGGELAPAQVDPA